MHRVDAASRARHPHRDYLYAARLRYYNRISCRISDVLGSPSS